MKEEIQPINFPKDETKRIILPNEIIHTDKDGFILDQEAPNKGFTSRYTGMRIQNYDL